jgi:hypothetical protein
MKKVVKIFGGILLGGYLSFLEPISLNAQDESIRFLTEFTSIYSRKNKGFKENNIEVPLKNGIYPSGQLFEIQSFVIDPSLNGIRDSQTTIMQKNNLEDIIDMECNKANSNLDNLYSCNGYWDSSGVPEGNNTYTFHIEAENSKVEQDFHTLEYTINFRKIDSSLCKEVISGHNNSNENRINIVFTGYGYNTEQSYIRGDSNMDGIFDINDPVATLEKLFLGRELSCLDALDTNDDGILDIADPVASLESLFLGGANPSAPFPGLGTDPTSDKLTCSSISSEDLIHNIAAYIVNVEGDNNGIGAAEPVRSNFDKFNFWYIHQARPVEYCEDGGSCLDPEFLSYACQFDNAYRVSLVDLSFRPSPDRISAPYYENLGNIREWVPATAVHEIVGHLLGGLYDEYANRDETYSGPVIDGPNCYASRGGSTFDDCMANAPWINQIGDGCGLPGVIDCPSSNQNYWLEVGCFEGCANIARGIWRPTRHSIIQSSTIRSRPFSFGPVNEQRLCEIIKDVTGSVSGICTDKYGIR